MTEAVVLVGGGLANGLIALRLRALRPEVPVTLLERDGRMGGNHTWSFHDGDVSTLTLGALQPLVVHSWASQGVRFPGLERHLTARYHSITSDSLHGAVSRALGEHARCGVEVTEVLPHEVRLANGERLPASLVVDGRGMQPTSHFELRWQKFLGLELELDGPHGLEAPVIMDATVEQLDGYRFMYLLPFGPRRLLVEDTCYSDTPQLRVPALRERVHAYADTCGLRVAAVVREETGVLPIVLDGDPGAFWREAGAEIPRAGMRAMLFHHTTGYSLPDAVRLAELIANAPRLESGALAQAVRGLSQQRWREQRFYRLLNRLLFEAAEPAERWRALRHFYASAEPLIARFYAGRTSTADAMRLLSGRAPVPLARALRCIARGLVPAGTRTGRRRPA